jgi:hypothetical protein
VGSEHSSEGVAQPTAPKALRAFSFAFFSFLPKRKEGLPKRKVRGRKFSSSY